MLDLFRTGFLFIVVICFFSHASISAQEIKTIPTITVPNPLDEFRKLLYEKKDFREVEDKVASYLKNPKNGYESKTLSKLYGKLTYIPSGEKVARNKHALAMLKTLDAWCEASPDSHVPWTVRGGVYISYAWVARGGKYAHEVEDAAWPRFHERLLMAQRDLEKAYHMQPVDPNASIDLITVAKGLGMPRKMMEIYYRQAVNACPDCYYAASNKIEYLLPRWHGTWQDVYAFAYDCLDQVEKTPNLALAIVDAHYHLARVQGMKDKVYGNLENWHDVDKVYQIVIKHAPDPNRTKYYYARNACRFKQYDVAEKLFNELGDLYRASNFGSKENFNAWRRFVYYKRAYLYRDQKQIDKSIRAFRRVIEIPGKPKDDRVSDSYLNLSYLHGHYKRNCRFSKYYVNLILNMEAPKRTKDYARHHLRFCK